MSGFQSHSIRLLMPLLGIVLACSIMARGQSGRKPVMQPGREGQTPAEKPIVRLETREVVIPLRAYNSEGNPVDDLSDKDVLVLEDGEARPISQLKREPANIVLVLDLNNEIGTFKNGPIPRFAEEKRPIWETAKNYRVVAQTTTQELVGKFVSQISPQDRIAIIQYAERPQLVQDWTSDPNEAITALNAKYRIGIKSSFYDAMKMAADKLEGCQKGRRVIVLISDGLDSNSRIDRRTAVTALEKSRASLFVLGWAEALRSEVELAISWMQNHEARTTSSHERLLELRRYLPQLEAGAMYLRNLAEASGGEIWLPESHEGMLKSPSRLVGEIGSQYSLAFITETKPSLENLRKIEVLPARPGLSLRSRRNYYAGESSSQ